MSHAFLTTVGSAARRGVRRRRFAGSSAYWEKRYRGGGNSGDGSYGMQAEFKAQTLNRFVAAHDVSSVLELGCGDGAQLALAQYPRYTGVDVSTTVLDRCRARFADDHTKSFVPLDRLPKVEPHELTLSLDVIFHLVEDDVYEAHMRSLFASATRFVIIFSTDFDDPEQVAPHARRRRFTSWAKQAARDWDLIDVVRHPGRPAGAGPFTDRGDESFADFFVYARRTDALAYSA